MEKLIQNRPNLMSMSRIKLQLSFRHLLERWFFSLAFCFRWKSFVLIHYILSETICLFCFCVLFSNIYTKIKFTAKSWSDLCNFFSEVIFLNFCLRKQFLLFFAEFEFWMFHNNIVKILEKMNKWYLLKIWLQITFPVDFCRISSRKPTYIMLTPLNPTFYNKTEVCRGIHYFSYFCSKHRLWVLVWTASSRRF